jgi:hypothetical protein
MEQIARQPTRDEVKEYKVLGNKSVKDIFMKQLAELMYKFAKEHKPFDKQCALLDFQDEIDRIQKESERIRGYVSSEEQAKLKFDLEKYGDSKRFDIVDEEEDYEIMNINGIRTSRKVGKTIKYKCKNRGHFCSVFIPVDLKEIEGGK